MSFKRKNGQAPAKKDYTKLKTPHTYAIIFFVVIVCWLLTATIIISIRILWRTLLQRSARTRL